MPLKLGDRVLSCGGSYEMRIIGACCRLYDREELPYPSCSMQWRGKEPSWNRVGKRFVPDMAARRSPSYCVVATDPGGGMNEPYVTTFFWQKLTKKEGEWWCSKSTPSNLKKWAQQKAKNA